MASRRELMKLGLIGGAFALLRGGRGNTQTTGLFLTPFLDRLPLPPPPNEIDPHRTAPLPAEFNDLDHDCRQFIDFTGKKGKTHFYKIVEEVRRVKSHSQLPPTEIWGYRDGTLRAGTSTFAVGPTFIVHATENPADGVVVRHFNALPSVANHRGFGEPRTTTHLHGGHHPSRSDGFPTDIILPNGRAFKPVIEHGGHYDYCYPLTEPGFFDDPTGALGLKDPTERPSTLWYHDHLLDFTGPNVYRGLAGFFLVFEDPKSKSPAIRATARDTGDETNAAGLPLALRLPSGPFDIPLVLQDKTFGPDGQLVFDEFNFDGFLGDQFLVNGMVQPFLPVKRRKYRFRFLNGSGARFYQVFLTDQDGRTYPMTQIATEGGLLSRPITRESFMLGNAERVEVVIDFSKFPHPRFKELFFENRLVQDEGRGPEGTYDEPKLTPHGTRLMKLVLEEEVHDPSRVPNVLRPFQPVSNRELAAATVREFEFERRHGLWVINGEVAGDLTQPLATPRRDRPEIWRIVNKSGGWWHPIHVHNEYARVLTRNGQTPFGGTGHDHGQPIEQDGVAKKDTIILGPNDEAELFFRFRDFTGPFVFHCHNIAHEDHAMMARFDVD